MTRISRSPTDAATITLEPEHDPGCGHTVWRGSCRYDEEPDHETWGMTYTSLELAQERARERYGDLAWADAGELAA
ncbi:MAG: hypothetical protein KF809_15090 [Chloroflexi bacterium]|nr:hypothetical protein [Chloroflexota bacterium]